VAIVGMALGSGGWWLPCVCMLALACVSLRQKALAAPKKNVCPLDIALTANLPCDPQLAKIADDARMSGLTHEQEQLAGTLVQCRLDHVTAEESFQLCASFVARARAGEDFSEIAGKEAFEDMNTQIMQCRKLILDRKEKYLQIIHVNKKLNTRSKSWISSIQDYQKQYGDYLIHLNKSALATRERMFDRMKEKVEDIADEAEAAMQPTMQLSEVQWPTIDAANNLVLTMKHNPALEAEIKKRFLEAKAESDQLLKNEHQALKVWTAAKTELDQLVKAHMTDQRILEKRLGLVRVELEEAKQSRHERGVGYWEMCGKPCDKISEELQHAWENGGKLREYQVVGKFSMKKFTTLTESQKQAYKRFEELLKEEENMLKEIAKLDVGPINDKKAQCDQLQSKYVEARTEYLNKQKSLCEGINIPPAVKAQVVAIQRMAQCMTNQQQKFLPCDTEMENVNCLLDELKAYLQPGQRSVTLIHETLQKLQIATSDPTINSAVLLMKLGKQKLSNYIMPPVDPGRPMPVEDLEQLDQTVQYCETAGRKPQMLADGGVLGPHTQPDLANESSQGSSE